MDSSMFQIHYMGRRRATGVGKFGPGLAFSSSISTRDVKNANRLRQKTALFAIVSIICFQKKNTRFHIPNLNAVSDVQWVRMFDSSLPIRKLLFRGRRVLAETKTKVWTFAIFVPQRQEQRPTSIAGVEWDIEIHQMNCWMTKFFSSSEVVTMFIFIRVFHKNTFFLNSYCAELTSGPGAKYGPK